MSAGEGQPPPRGSYGGITRGRARSRGRALPAPHGIPADQDAMRAARRRWASGVGVVATRVEAGLRGATVSAVAPVSLEPPLLLVCLDRSGRIATAVPEAGCFALSVLDRALEAIADRFAGLGPLPDARFTGIPYVVAPSGCPVITGALAWFDCRVRDVHDGGDHVIVVGAVGTIGLGEDTDDPLLSYEGRYRGIESA